VYIYIKLVCQHNTNLIGVKGTIPNQNTLFQRNGIAEQDIQSSSCFCHKFHITLTTMTFSLLLITITKQWTSKKQTNE